MVYNLKYTFNSDFELNSIICVTYNTIHFLCTYNEEFEVPKQMPDNCNMYWKHTKVPAVLTCLSYLQLNIEESYAQSEKTAVLINPWLCVPEE